MEKVKQALWGQTVSLENLLKVEVSIIQHCQQQRFQKEIAALSAGRSVATGQCNLQTGPKIEWWPFKSRWTTEQSWLCLEKRNTLVLSKDQYISTLILRQIHEHLGHSIRNLNLSKLHKMFWITNANLASEEDLATTVNYCAKVGEQKMSDLAKERLLSVLPLFMNVGVDQRWIYCHTGWFCSSLGLLTPRQSFGDHSR